LPASIAALRWTSARFTALAGPCFFDFLFLPTLFRIPIEILLSLSLRTSTAHPRRADTTAGREAPEAPITTSLDGKSGIVH